MYISLKIDNFTTAKSLTKQLLPRTKSELEVESRVGKQRWLAVRESKSAVYIISFKGLLAELCMKKKKRRKGRRTI